MWSCTAVCIQPSSPLSIFVVDHLLVLLNDNWCRVLYHRCALGHAEELLGHPSLRLQVLRELVSGGVALRPKEQFMCECRCSTRIHVLVVPFAD